jgi:hypothetical protein
MAARQGGRSGGREGAPALQRDQQHGKTEHGCTGDGADNCRIAMTVRDQSEREAKHAAQ